MDTRFAISKQPSLPLHLSLLELWTLEADPSYDVIRSNAPKDRHIAIRTTKGRGMLETMDNERFILESRSLIILKYEKIKRYCCAENCWNFWWFSFLAAPDLRMPHDEPMEADIYAYESLLVEECLRLLQSENSDMTSAASSIFSVLLNTWLQNYKSKNSGTRPYESVFQDIAGYMRSNPDKGIKVYELARRAGLCERRFRDVFNELFGMTPKKYLELYRIESAKALLSNTSLSISEIAEKLGYSSQFHFTRNFRDIEGSPPTVFRRGG